MTDYEKPTWERFDSVRSLRDIGKMFLEWLDRKDTELADALNREEDDEYTTTERSD